MPESRLMTEFQKNQLQGQLKFTQLLSLIITYVVVIGMTQFIAGFFDVKVSLQTPFIVLILGFVLLLYFVLLLDVAGFVKALRNWAFQLFVVLAFAGLIYLSTFTNVLPTMFTIMRP